jgi:SAM-dependent methyltransferase
MACKLCQQTICFTDVYSACVQVNATVTAAEIARLAGVGRAAVSNWRKRHLDFPAQVGGTAASPEFDLGHVKEWLRKQGKLSDRSAEEMLWWHIAAAGDDQLVTLGDIGAFLLDHKKNRKRAKGASEQLADLLAQVGILADEGGIAATFDDLLRQFSESPAARVRPTPSDLAEFMAGLADVAGGSVLDPACGTGALLQSAVRAGCSAAFGQDVDGPTARVAGLWLNLHDVPGEVRLGDSLRADAFPDHRVDVVLCSPPFGLTNWGQEELGYDPRWEYGTPPRTEPELAWVQHALAHLRPDGRAIVLMPPAAAARRAGRRIRAELLRRGAIRAIVALPARAAASHGVPLHLWVLRRPIPDLPPPAYVLHIDASDTPAAGLKSVYSHVLASFRAFAAGQDHADESGMTRVISVIELLDHEVDLNPVRRPAVINVKDSSERLTATRQQLAALVTDLARLIPDLAASNTAMTPQTVSIADLAKTGALQILGPAKATVSKASADERIVLTVADVLQGRAASGRLEQDVSPEIVVQEGDVVVPAVARQMVAQVVTAGGALLGPNLYLLRPHQAALDPGFLAGQLRTSTNERQASSLSGVLRFDIRKALVPRMALDDQRRCADAFARLDAFDSALRQTTTLGAELVRLVADGLARGILQPDGGAKQPPEGPAKRKTPKST